MDRLFGKLTDDEIYMLSRVFIESSYIFIMGDERVDTRYSNEEITTFCNLMHKVDEERRLRRF